jgi:hypothetical protein
MARPRRYDVEYARRVRNALARGLTRSQARGHPAAGTPHISGRGKKLKSSKPDRTLEDAIKAIRQGETLTAAAKNAGVSRERLSAYAKQYAGAARHGRRWTFNDARVRRIPIIAAGEVSFLTIKVPGFEPAHLAGQHFDEASKALEDHELFPSFIERWTGVSITDVNGNDHLFATEPSQLYRVIGADEIDWARIYHLYMP